MEVYMESLLDILSVLSYNDDMESALYIKPECSFT